jgi:hypothetical protein
MSRYKSQHTNQNPVPAIKLWKVTKTSPKKIKRKLKVTKDKVNQKTLYFTALYNQHNEFKSYLIDKEKATLNHCPSFHNTFLKIKKPYSSSNDTKLISKTRATRLSADSPLYSLPLDNMSNTLKAVITTSINHQQVITKAIEAHTSRTLLELKEFCNTGTSQNYYNFANVITHVQTNKTSFHREKDKSMKSLLKTTIYSNLAILKNLDQVTIKGRMPASSRKNKKVTTQEVNNILETNWTTSYFDSL